MPFGLTGAPGSFQRLMNKVFRGLTFVTTYIDDVLIHSINREMPQDPFRTGISVNQGGRPHS